MISNSGYELCVKILATFPLPYHCTIDACPSGGQAVTVLIPTLRLRPIRLPRASHSASKQAGGDGSDPTAKEELLANLHRAESAELHAEATFSELMRATAVYGSEAAFEFAMQDEKVEGQTLEMTVRLRGNQGVCGER